ncbi:MAG: RES family NAD+ phosphorylase [Chloroflexia bacterium]|nr:RES family NAD+ phosphorylase [Chloroflexia bacterium]
MVAIIAIPQSTLFRVGRSTGPLEFPPVAFTGDSRFDDFPDTRSFRVLYVGDRRACFFECLEDFLPDEHATTGPPHGITADWFRRRRIASCRVDDPLGTMQWLDLFAPETLRDFRTRFRHDVRACHLSTLDASVAMSEHRLATQSIGRWAYSEGFHGIKYRTRHDITRECWAIFDRTQIRVVDPGAMIRHSDPDLQIVVQQWNMPMPPPHLLPIACR